MLSRHGNRQKGISVKQSEMFRGMIAYRLTSGGEIRSKVKILRIGLSQTPYGRADCSEVGWLKPGEGVLEPLVYEDNDYNRRWYPEKIGQPKTEIVKNRLLMSLSDGDRKIQADEERRAKQQCIQELMEQARAEMSALLVQHGISVEEVHVQARYDAEADVAEVTSVRITGESIERMIQVFRDFDAGT
jgi:hypothetical protein